MGVRLNSFNSGVANLRSRALSPSFSFPSHLVMSTLSPEFLISPSTNPPKGPTPPHASKHHQATPVPKDTTPMTARDGLLGVSFDASSTESHLENAASRTSSSSYGSSTGFISRQLSGSSVGSSSHSRAGLDTFRSLGSFEERELHLAGVLARLHASSTSGGSGGLAGL